MNFTAYREISVRGTGQHRLTRLDRIAVWVRSHLYYATIPFVLVVVFWGLVVAAAGFLAGFVWGLAQ